MEEGYIIMLLCARRMQQDGALGLCGERNLSDLSNLLNSASTLNIKSQLHVKRSSPRA